WIYRTVMQILYRGQYQNRFQRVCRQLRETDRTVLELCFADVVVANYCRRHSMAWTGIDQSDAFVALARRRQFDARQADLLRPEKLPLCDVCVMMGSLYQFRGELEDLFLRIKACSSRFVLSEPIRNWTHSNGLLRFMATRLTRTEPYTEPFRFTARTLVQTLNRLQNAIGFEYRIVHTDRDMLVEVTWLK
ncbi:MAG: hypothetical protein H7831_17430, partial [Magnetococcus sp. WYHC-3]